MPSVQVTIKGTADARSLFPYDGGGKSKCVTRNSNVAGVGQYNSNEFILEYDDEQGNSCE